MVGGGGKCQATEGPYRKRRKCLANPVKCQTLFPP